MLLLRATAALLAGCTAGWTPPPVIDRGVHVALATSSPDAVCGGTLADLDHTVETLFDYFAETPPPGPFIRYRWLTSRELEGSPCAPFSSVACTYETDSGIQIDSIAIPHEHELAHAMHRAAFGDSDPVLNEGFAMLYGERRTEWEPPARELALGTGEGPQDEAEDALAVRIVQSIEVTHGRAAIGALMRAVARDASRRQAEEQVERILGEPWVAVVDRAIGWSYCAPQVGLCDAPPVAWHDGVVRQELDLRCAADDAVGPDRAVGGWTHRWLTVDVPRDGRYELLAVTEEGIDEPVNYAATMLACGPCPPGGARTTLEFTTFSADFAAPVEVSAGRYALVAAAYALDAPPIALSIRPLD